MIFIFVTIAFFITLWWYLSWSLNHWTRMGVKQTRPWLIVGDSFPTLFGQISVPEFIQSIYNLYPNEKYVGLYNFQSPVLMFRDPELFKEIAIKDFDHFTDHAPFVDPEADPLWSKNLLSLKGERWKEIRNIVSPVFISSKMKLMFDLIKENSEDLVNYFQENNEEIMELDMNDLVNRFANDVIASAAFGLKVNSSREKENRFYLMGKQLTNFRGLLNSIKFVLLQVYPKFFKIVGSSLLDKEAGKFFSDIIGDTIKMREEKNIVRPDVIHILMEAQKKQAEAPTGKINISNLDIASQCLIFFFAGFDTISTSLSFGMYELATNPDVQNKLREEILETIKTGPLTYDTLLQMRYLDMVVSEMLRKWPQFPFLDRVCTKPYVVDKKIQIKPNSEVWIPIYALHRDPQYFPDPDKFNPERFDPKKNTITPYTYLPFGLGPRSCIGNRFAIMEMKSFLFHLLSKYEIVPTEKTSIPLVLSKNIQLGAENGFWMGLKRI
ncbi:hypothetical protein ABEB36_014603 [Hypothenemus hampei]|uniref:Cytochrome P450 n=1 Tax=Hypothenemus hampei TaxID=57062 RepID=A0ABD1E4D2_HYPHA